VRSDKKQLKPKEKREKKKAYTTKNDGRGLQGQ
jgi:hypothetical protein